MEEQNNRRAHPISQRGMRPEPNVVLKATPLSQTCLQFTTTANPIQASHWYPAMQTLHRSSFPTRSCSSCKSRQYVPYHQPRTTITHFSSDFLCCDNRFSLSASSASLSAFFSSAFLAFLRWILVSTGSGVVVLDPAGDKFEMENASVY